MQARPVAIVTGGAGLIGRAVAARLAHEGAEVAILDLDPGDSTRSLALRCDVTNRQAVREAVDLIATKLGPPTVLVNSAGILRSSPFLTLTETIWDEVLRVNVTGTLIASQEVAGLMPEGSGSIINLSSVAAVIANSGQAAYAASKAAVLALTRAAAVELAPRGITVNAIAPGPVEPAADGGALSGAAREERLQRIPANRFCTADEVAAAVAYLSSAAARYITGSVIWMDGGLTITGIRA
jgi:3-oxoacyl-[acyl-carrier protein] reductase